MVKVLNINTKKKVKYGCQPIRTNSFIIKKYFSQNRYRAMVLSVILSGRNFKVDRQLFIYFDREG